jgi:DNA-binding NarL/FixJ family response regulator
MKWLLIDDHSLFRDGLSLLIAQRLTLPGAVTVEALQAGDLREATAQLQAHPDVGLALLDLGLPGFQGLEALRAWRQQAPDIPVVVLSSDDRPDTIVAAIDLGASGFIPKSAHASVMQEALVHVLGGGVYLPAIAGLPEVGVPEGEVWIGQTPATGRNALTTFGLSDRQRDVLRFLIEGKTNKEICRRLGLSESTIKTHLAAIFRKLGVTSRTQVVVAVARAGVSLAQGLDKTV